MACVPALAVPRLAAELADAATPLPRRFRALFALRNAAPADAAAALAAELRNKRGAPAIETALVRHEVAFCLGQMGATEPVALAALRETLSDEQEDPMVRHEAGEALGAIADGASEALLERLASSAEAEASTPREVVETCMLALRRLRTVQKMRAAATADGELDEAFSGATPYKSVDPAPAADADATDADLLAQLTDEGCDLWMRYGALFALRNRGGSSAARAVAAALGASSALLRHEAAYSLGQLQSDAANAKLRDVLNDNSEHPMVRHEAAEALGSIATDEAEAALRSAMEAADHPIVAQACEVALDILACERSGEEYIAPLTEEEEEALANGN